MKAIADEYTCPSAQPDMPRAKVFGIVGGTADQPEVAYLKSEARVEIGDAGKLGVDPNLVFRIAADCDEARCGNFKDGKCSLGKKIATGLPAVVDVPPPCLVRSSCRWFAENSYTACLRCPQVVTLSLQPDAG